MMPMSVVPARRSRAASEIPALPPPITATRWLMVFVDMGSLLGGRRGGGCGSGWGGQPCGHGVVEGVVDVDDVATGPVEQARGDRRAVAAGAVHPELAGRQRVEFGEQLVQRNVRCPGDEAGGVFVVAADVEDHHVGVGGGVGVDDDVWELGETVPGI